MIDQAPSRERHAAMRAAHFADSGMGTTPGMWEMVSEELDKVALPTPVNNAIYALLRGEAVVTERKP